MKIILMCLICLFIISEAGAQLPLKRDDFTSSQRKSWWQYDLEGTAEPATIINGLLRFRMPSADDTNPWCNTSIWDGNNMYGSVIMTIRARMTSPVRPGSRGWGLWYTSPLNSPSTQAWFMDVGDDPGYPDYNSDNVWQRASVANMYLIPGYWIDEADINENMQQWHTYKIIREIGGEHEFVLYIDGTEVLTSDIQITEHLLSVQIWNDNLVYTRDPLGYLRREWSGGNADEFVVDFVEVLTEEHPGQSITPNGMILLREIPFEVGLQQDIYEWKNYSFSSQGGKCVIILTARAEQYGTYGEDDDIRIVVDGYDYGWNSIKSINGSELDGTTKTIVIDTTLGPGSKNIRIYGKNSPILYDVTVLGSEYGNIILNESLDQTASGGDDVLMQSYNFYCNQGDVAFYISGTADEDLSPSDYGRSYSDFNDGEDDDIRIVIDGNDYGWQNDDAIWGNRLFGESKSVLIVENLLEGMHTLEIYSNQTPTLHNVIIYGQNEDYSLPVQLNSFNVIYKRESIALNWETASEINNLGFNIYKFSGRVEDNPAMESFSKINREIIPGAGSSSEANSYQYIDYNIGNAERYSYFLEWVTYNGSAKSSEIKTIALKIPENFILRQNYPNPFNSRTAIEYELQDDALIRLEINNLLGENICILKDGYVPKGKHILFWNAKNRNSRDLPSGIYIYRLIQANQILTKKMLYLK